MTYLLILRAINGGRWHQVKMQTLRHQLQQLGLTQVQSYATSGNLFFTTTSDRLTLQSQIATLLATNYTFPINWGLFSQVELQNSYLHIPNWWVPSNQSQSIVLFKLHDYQIENDNWLLQHQQMRDQLKIMSTLIFWQIANPTDFQGSCYQQLTGTRLYGQTSTRSYRRFQQLMTIINNC